MKFLILTSTVHKQLGDKYYAYEPFIKEMNIWLRHPKKVLLVAPLQTEAKPENIDLEYNYPDIEFISIPEFNIQSGASIIKTLFILPLLIIKISSAIHKADHIHLRCPGNVGLISCMVQIFFPNKKKTAKYAGNWDWHSKQPWSYRLQQRILRNTFLTRNMTALVYGEWPDKTRNIKSFFTASYYETERFPVVKKPFTEGVNLAFVGTLTENKSPITCLEVLKELAEKGINATLTYCGEGPERIEIGQKIQDYQLKDKVKLLGNVDAEKVKEVLQEAHFLVFISRSEGWPKAVSEAMWWGCLPITTAVSCVPQMLDYGERGDLVGNNVDQIVSLISHYFIHTDEYLSKTERAKIWSREFTIERFESEIKKLLLD